MPKVSPTELILEVLDLAYYWVVDAYEFTTYCALKDLRWDGEHFKCALYLSAQLPVGDKYKIKELDSTIVSHDHRFRITGDVHGTIIFSS